MATRGRKPGVKVGPRVGSRPWKLLQLEVGESLLLEAPAGRLVPFMGQVQVDASRNGVKITQSLLYGVDPKSRAVLDIVRVTRLA